MSITRSNLTDELGPRGRRTEYTRKCGWIDWAHAGPDRPDLKAIWSALKSPPRLQPNGSYAPSDRSRIAFIQGYTYLRVPFELDMGTMLWVGSNFPKKAHHGYVRLQPSNTPQFYKRAALSLYHFACNTLEGHQSKTEWLSESSYSMEDMVSNRLAFYQLVEGVSADTMITQIGGWADRNEALKMSRQVFDAMDRAHPPQPRPSTGNYAVDKVLERQNDRKRTQIIQPKGQGDWIVAYLFNDVAGIDDKRGGWQPMPKFLTDQMDLFSTILPPGANIGIDWPDPGISDPFGPEPKGRWHHHRLSHLPTSGPSKRGRTPGPEGIG